MSSEEAEPEQASDTRPPKQKGKVSDNKQYLSCTRPVYKHIIADLGPSVCSTEKTSHGTTKVLITGQFQSSPRMITPQAFWKRALLLFYFQSIEVLAAGNV